AFLGTIDHSDTRITTNGDGVARMYVYGATGGAEGGSVTALGANAPVVSVRALDDDGPVPGTFTATTTDNSGSNGGIYGNNGTATITGGSITQTGTQNVHGIEVVSGSATVSGTDFVIDGQDGVAGGLYTNGADAEITANDVDISVTV